ncbi:hypothetical protein HHK36_002043 [Tetracentron sinense]|uniref:BHLH domain-containing protein n=1 Tax=Tetracentron sinense TaxID=13715 RepID=A0A834ZTS3_TETSI|nr:hypothetical protein HHK36_002043 [Tetracentron sinense]
MADKFQTGICSGKWWSSSKNGFNGVSSPCSTTVNVTQSSFGWPTEKVEIKARSCEESASVSGSSIVSLDTQKLQGPDCVTGGSSILMDSALQMMDFRLSSTKKDWNQALLRTRGRSETNIHPMLQEDSSSRPNFRQEMGLESPGVPKNWSPKNFFSGGDQNSSSDTLKQMDQIFALNHQPLNSSNIPGDCTVTSQGLPTNIPMYSALYGCPSTSLQSLCEPDLQPQQSLYENGSMNYESPTDYCIDLNEFSPSWSEFPQLLKSSHLKQQSSNQLHFSNKAPFWNASAAAMNDVPSGYFSSSQTQFLTPTFEESPNCSNTTEKATTGKVRESGSVVKKSSRDPPVKRPRIETPSPLPTSKVPKEKLGDRVTALQQLVSPFGKTDTASVLFEAIEYIKLLHEQVNVLSTPYMKNGAPMQHQQNNSDKSKKLKGFEQDLRSRGLCLVPISNTFPVTSDTSSDFWTPKFGGTFR